MRESLKLTLTTAPASLPVSLNEAKKHLCIEDDQTGNDALIVAYLSAAVRACEKFTGRALVSQTWTLFRNDWPRQRRQDVWWDGVREGAISDMFQSSRALELPRPPLQSVVHIKTYTDGDVASTFATTKYLVDTASEPGRIVLRNDAEVPDPTRAANGLEVQFVAGYGDNPGDVPEELRTGILQLVAHLYEQREPVVDGAVMKTPFSVEALWQIYKVMSL